MLLSYCSAPVDENPLDCHQYWRRAGILIETVLLFVEKRPGTDDHSIYSVRHSSNSVYRNIKKNSVSDTLKRFPEKTTEF